MVRLIEQLTCIDLQYLFIMSQLMASQGFNLQHSVTFRPAIFDNKPCRPRYTFIWDVKKVLNYLLNNYDLLPPHKDFSDEELPMKLTMTLDLTVAALYFKISYLNIKFTAKGDQKCFLL